MRTSQIILKFSRKIHLYLGLFTAPALLFFAFTGAVQTFNLHEATQGSSYAPPKWLVALGQLHKKQTIIVPIRKPKPPLAFGGGAQSADADSRPGFSTRYAIQKGRSVDGPMLSANRHVPMKVFFLLVAVALGLSTLSGVYMAWRYSGAPLVIALLLAGVVVPSVLLAF